MKVEEAPDVTKTKIEDAKKVDNEVTADAATRTPDL